MSIPINITNKEGHTALLLLCSKQGREIFTLLSILLERNDVDLGALDKRQNNALGLLCGNNRSINLSKAVKLLLDRCINVHQTNQEGDNALMVLCANYKHPAEMEEAMNHLIAAGIDVNVANSRGLTALHILCSDYNGDNMDTLIKLIIGAGGNVNAVDKEGNTALHHLCTFYHREKLLAAIKVLVEAKVDVKATNCEGMDGLLSFLYWSEKISDLLDIMKTLIDAGSDVNSKSVLDECFGFNSLLALCSQQYLHQDFIPAINLLIAHQVDLSVTNKEGCNALMFLCAQYKGQQLIEAIELLIQAGINVNAKTSITGFSAPVLLLKNTVNKDQFTAVIGVLIKAGFDVKIVDAKGSNLLHWLCQFPATKDLFGSVLFLVDKGIDPTAADNFNRKPIYHLKQVSTALRKKYNLEKIADLLSR